MTRRIVQVHSVGTLRPPISLHTHPLSSRERLQLAPTADLDQPLSH